MSSRLDPHALIGTKLRDRYVVEAFAGAGRFSAVYRAIDAATERPVALRLLRVKDTLMPSRQAIIIDRLRSLTRSISEVAAPCPSFADVLDVAPLITTSERRWMPVMVQTWMAGEPLETVLARERLAERSPRSLARAIDLLTPVADALGYAHARGLVHGSLSPRTLFVRNAARDGGSGVEILDLGIAQALATTQAWDRAFEEPAYGALHFFAPTYRSPEHFSGDPPSLVPASDVFALALIVVELVSGSSPPPEDGDDDRLFAAALDPVSRPAFGAHRKALGYVEAVFARALAVRVEERFATVSAFWEALRSASRMTALRPSSRSSRPPPLPAGLARAESAYEAAPGSGLRDRA